MDPKVNGQLQTEWSWLIAIYLFLGGIGGGAYTIAAVNGFVGDAADLSTTIGLWISFPALLIGSGALLLDLGSPTRAVLAGLRPKTSWIARGFWIISVFMAVAFVHWALYLFSDVRPDGSLVSTVAVVGILFAVSTMAYTGILLGASKGIPFWRSGVVPVVFVISALVTGHFTIMLGMTVFGEGAELTTPLRTMALEAAALVVLETLAIFFFLQAGFKLPDPRESTERILRKPMFLAGYFLLGLAVPLVLMVIVYRAMRPGGTDGLVALVAVGALLGLAGGLILRQAVLTVGALPTLNIAGFQFRRIARPKEPKAGIGRLPPQ